MKPNLSKRQKPLPAAKRGASQELEQLRARLAEAEETLRAIQQGEVDALVVGGAGGEQIFTLQGAETPYRLLVEEMNEGALLVAADGTILFANARFAKLAELGLEQVIGSAWKGFFPAAEQPRLERLAATPEQGGAKAEFSLLTGAGAARAVEVSLAWMKRQGVEGFCVVVTDLSERKAAEEALHASNAKLRELVGELEQFSYSISHDMRAPLRAIKSFAVLLEESCTACEQAENRGLLARISAAASRMDTLIQGSLDYARIVKEELVLQSVELARLLPELLETYPNLLPDKADILLEGRLPVVLGNESALTQVFSNLLGNAVKFVPAGTKPRIRVWAEAVDSGESIVDRSRTSDYQPSTIPPHFVRICIQDNGIGISPQAQRRIFELFQRATKDYEGTGIGLAVVRKVVERMGGKVGVESEPGKGSRFWVELRTFVA